MPRMFDVLRGKDNQDRPEEKGPTPHKDAEAAVNFPRQIHHIVTVHKKPEDAGPSSKELIDVVKSKGVDNLEIAKEKYTSALKIVVALIEKVKREEPLDSFADEIYNTVDTLANQLILGDSLLELVTQDYPVQNYLSRHIVNVCILSLAIGMQMKLQKSEMHILGMAVFLYDIGMAGVKEIVKQPRRLLKNEIKEVENHILKGVEIISKMKGPYPYDVIKEVIEQHHERVDGKGYPAGIKGHQINNYVKILGLADTYEAMTHCRSYRQAKMAHQVLREIMDTLKASFQPEVIKALVNKISIYPIGSFVRLGGDEGIAKVISANPTSPLRPVVLTLFDAYGRPIPEPRMLDLSKKNSIYIKEPVLLKEAKD